MKRNGNLILLFVGVFLVIFFVIEKSRVLGKVFVGFRIFIEDYNNTIRWIINGGCSLIITILFMVIILLYIKKEEKKETPIIRLETYLVTGIRKGKWDKNIPEINIGEGIYFIYIISSIRNIGEGVIEKCKINKQILKMKELNNKNECKFCFRVCKKENEEFNKSYRMEVKFLDARGRIYTKKIDLRISELEDSAEIIEIGKQKRRSTYD